MCDKLTCLHVAARFVVAVARFVVAVAATAAALSVRSLTLVMSFDRALETEAVAPRLTAVCKIVAVWNVFIITP